MRDASAALSPADVAARWSCSAEHVLALIHAGRLQAFSLSAPGSKRPRWRVSPEAVATYEARHAARKPTPETRTRRRTPEAVGPY